MADAEVERRVDFRIVEFHQYVGAANAELGGSEGNEGSDIEALDADHLERGVGGGEAETAGVFVEIVWGGLNVGTIE